MPSQAIILLSAVCILIEEYRRPHDLKNKSLLIKFLSPIQTNGKILRENMEVFLLPFGPHYYLLDCPNWEVRTGSQRNQRNMNIP